MGIIVQKYGGTSVADSQKIKNVAKRITQSHKDGNLVVVVVSVVVSVFVSVFVSVLSVDILP